MMASNNTSVRTNTSITTTLAATTQIFPLSTATSAPDDNIYIFIYSFVITSVFIILIVAACVSVWFRMKKTPQNATEMTPYFGKDRNTRMVKVLPTLPAPHTKQLNQREERMSRLFFRGSFQTPTFTLEDLSLLEIFKIGKQGRFYRAKITRGYCKGHRLVTCKLYSRNTPHKNLETEINIMKKLSYHKNIVQLLDWNSTQEPYLLIMEQAECGTLKNLLQNNRIQLSNNKELKAQLTSAAYFISLGLEHMASKKVVHRDIAARNILVCQFPQGCKIAEFGLARDLSNSKVVKKEKGQRPAGIPFRWYPPEYFTDGIYTLQSDIWAFGILLYEMETLGSSPYPEFETADEVILNVCSGYKMKKPRQCRNEIYEVMQFCWSQAYEERPLFSDIIKYLEDLVENDAVSDHRQRLQTHNYILIDLSHSLTLAL
uniref:Tyrosine kinase receptor Cad96Ca-like n=1 Tax=Callorhinchus milii TaxID=7868 RepID=A0A4W3JBC7_CALMI